MRIGKLALALVLTLAAVATAACGGGDTPSSAPQELVYGASNQGISLDNDKAVLRPELDKFEKASGIKIKLEVVPWTDLLNRILAATTSGKGPEWDSGLGKRFGLVRVDYDTQVRTVKASGHRYAEIIAEHRGTACRPHEW
ncbi:family 1 glycosylhydrolase [Amycolatopsis sp. QT-25]|nr:family 1 glycosylhydrolase [Amycolatopsis sp. QT-25]WET76567.1 family 1 glycosylhydrolase [Amycolatopsis sp. QT-25]